MKFNLQLKKAELNVVYDLTVLMIEQLSEELKESRCYLLQLQIIILKKFLSDKLAKKITFPESENKVSMNHQEALVWMARIQKFDLLEMEPYVMATINHVAQIESKL